MRRTARDTEDSARQITRRGLFLGGSMVAFMAVLGGRMRYMQVDQADEFRLLAEENRVNIRLIPPARGLILDRKARVIAGNEQNYRVIITREDAGDVPAVLTRLSHVIPLLPDEVQKVVAEADRSSPFVPIIVKDRLPWEDFSRVALNAPSLPGVQPEVGLSRIYPLVGDFSHVVGYVGPVSEKDLEGIENPDPILSIPKFQIG
ncbi:MAG: penicillin-binding protein 2, partial [Paracoccaceae bacterium]